MTDINLFEKEFKKNSIIPKVIKNLSPYNFIVGGRNGHKSTEIQTFLFLEWLRSGKQFLLIRRKTSHTVNTWLSGHFNEVLAETDYYIEFTTKMLKSDKYTGYFIIKSKTDKDYKSVWGKVVYLSVEDTYRSNEIFVMDLLTYVVFEECVAKQNKQYLDNEPQLLVDTISTFFRSKQAIVFCIGNTNEGQEVNPLFNFFALDEWEYKQGQLIKDKPYNSTIPITLYLPKNLEKTNDYQNIKNNNVGTTGEWKKPKLILNEKIKNNHPIAEVRYRDSIYFVYDCNINNRHYYYFTEQFVTDLKYPLSLKEFINRYIIEQHKNYSIELLANIYIDFFDNDYNFKNLNKEHEIMLIDLNNNNILENLKTNNDLYLDKLLKLLSENVVFYSKKSIMFIIEKLRSEHIKLWL